MKPGDRVRWEPARKVERPGRWPTKTGEVVEIDELREGFHGGTPATALTPSRGPAVLVKFDHLEHSVWMSASQIKPE